MHYTIAKPFPVAVDGGILTREEEEEALNKALKRNEGYMFRRLGGGEMRMS